MKIPLHSIFYLSFVLTQLCHGWGIVERFCVSSKEMLTRMYLFLSDSVRSLHGQETEILLVYNDLPTNDFESLAQNIYG